MFIYTFIWILSSVFLSYEYWALETIPQYSILVTLQKMGVLSKEFNLSTDPGRPISLWLGWMGLSLMILMHIYSLRKRFEFMRNLGSMKTWLNFHVFCGLIGPTFILFHCDFKVRGLVAIAFWSMVVSFASGVIGRYFFVHLLTQKSELMAHSEKALKKLDSKLERLGYTIVPEEREQYLSYARQFAGLPSGAAVNLGVFSALAYSVVGDFRINFSNARLAPKWPLITDNYLRAYGLSERRVKFLGHFQKLMGYWHAFHFPFAIFMYAAAIIHVIAALVFGV